MSNFQDIVADAEKEAKKKLDEYRIKQEAELQAKQVQADLDKRIADRELGLRREQYLKDKFSSDPDKYTKAMVANSISTRFNISSLIDISKATSRESSVVSQNELQTEEARFTTAVIFLTGFVLITIFAIYLSNSY